MGGLVSRYYVQRLGGIERVRRLITISTPHQGTLWAHMVGNPGSRQMRPGSAFLSKLNHDAAMLERGEVCFDLNALRPDDLTREKFQPWRKL